MNQDGDSGGGASIGGDDIRGAVVVFVHRAREAPRRIYFILTRPTCVRNTVPPSGRQTGSENEGLRWRRLRIPAGGSRVPPRRTSR